MPDGTCPARLVPSAKFGLDKPAQGGLSAKRASPQRPRYLVSITDDDVTRYSYLCDNGIAPRLRASHALRLPGLAVAALTLQDAAQQPP